MKTVSGTITRANTYTRENGVENVAINFLTQTGEEKVAHLPWARFQASGIMLPEQLISTDIQVTYLSQGEKTLNGSICDKEETLVSSFIADAMQESASAFGKEIRQSLVDKKAESILANMEEQSAIRAKQRLERLKKLKAESSTPETTEKANAVPGLDKKQ